MVNYEDFTKLDIRIGKVLTCEDIPKTQNLLKISVDIGEKSPRTIISGIKDWYRSEDLIGKFILVLTNLKPRTLFGVKSDGMLLAADANDTAILLKTDEKFLLKLQPGQKIE
jgi:methionyl-tRNA synthetase